MSETTTQYGLTYYPISRKYDPEEVRIGDVLRMKSPGDLFVPLKKGEGSRVVGTTYTSTTSTEDDYWWIDPDENFFDANLGSIFDPQGANGETTITSPTGGSKGTKPEQYDQFPVEAIRTVAAVYAFGAEKYDAHNFRKGYKWSLSFSALCRHLWAFWGGEDNDPESGLPHMGHVAWHALCLMSFQKEHPEYDDRYKGES